MSGTSETALVHPTKKVFDKDKVTQKNILYERKAIEVETKEHQKYFQKYIDL